MMTKLAVALTLINAVVLAVALGCGPMNAASASPGAGDGILRGRGLQLVDREGRVRASISLLAATDDSTETVLVRLIDPDGRPSVKIGASERGGGISVCAARGSSCAVLDAEGDAPVLRLIAADEHQRVITP